MEPRTANRIKEEAKLRPGSSVSQLSAVLYQLLSTLDRPRDNPRPDVLTNAQVSLRTMDELLTAEVVLDLQLDEARYLILHLRDSESADITLSPREQEIARLVARGLPNKTIAEVLEISPWTVSTHLRRIFAKLGVNSRVEMVTNGMFAGLLQDTAS